MDDPRICLFCNFESQTINDSLMHMRTAHSFFVMDHSFCSNVAGLLFYLATKIQKHMCCIFCENKGCKEFLTPIAVQNHMMDKGHCFMNPEHYRDWEEYYDFSQAIQEIEEKEKGEVMLALEAGKEADGKKAAGDDWEDLSDNKGSDWESDASSDEEETVDKAVIIKEEEEQKAAPEGKPAETKVKKVKVDPMRTKYQYYKKRVKRAKVLENGEVELQNGKVVGHRVFKQYYKQYFRPLNHLENARKYKCLMDATKDRTLALLSNMASGSANQQLTAWKQNFLNSKFRFKFGDHRFKNTNFTKQAFDLHVGMNHNIVLQRWFRHQIPM